MDRWQELINYLDMIANWIQAFAAVASVCLLYKAYLIARKFREEHEEKIRIEREQRYAEKILELIKKIDLEMDSLFDSRILETQEGKSEIQRINQLTDVFTIHGINKIRYFYLRHLAIKLNKPQKWPIILALFRDMELYIGYFESKTILQNKARMLLACKALIEWAEDTFPKLANEKFETIEEYLHHFEDNIIPKFPDTMLVTSPFIKRYQKYRDNLTEEIFKILKGEKKSPI